MAHRPQDTHFTLHPSSFRSLKSEMGLVREWMDEHPREVVTLVFENWIHPDNQGLIDSELEAAGFGFHAGCQSAGTCVFNAKGPNPNIAVPGRPFESWDVLRHGFPTLNQLADANHRLVLFRNDLDNNVRTYDADVTTNIGPDWAAPRDGVAINDYKLPIFLVEHIPNGPATRPVGGIMEVNYNGEASVFKHWNDINARWHRIPQIVWFDFIEQDGDHLRGDPATPPDDLNGAMTLIQHLNDLRGPAPKITAGGSVVGANQFGWNKGDAKVNYSSSGDTAFRYVRSAWGDDRFDLRDGCERFDGPNCVASDTIYREGRTTVSVAAVGNNGMGIRSKQAYIQVNIDRTQPNIDCKGNAGTYLADQDVAISCTANDSMSGVQRLSHSSITGLAADLGVGPTTVVVSAADYADNVREHPETVTVVVTFGSVRNLTSRFVDEPLRTVLLNKLDAADRAPAASKADHLASYVDLLQKGAGRYVSPDRAAMLTRLAQAL